MQEQYLQSVLD